MAEPVEVTDPACITPPRRKRIWTPGSITNAFSAKRRRISTASVDLAGDLPAEGSSVLASESVADRFITARPEFSLPLDATPRSVRIAKVFGLVDDRVLKYTDSAPTASTSKEHAGHRFHYAKLLHTPNRVSRTSSVAHLGSRKQFMLALDGPGVPTDIFAYPLSWSRRNYIAVGCDKDVYYQDLDTRRISHMCRLEGGAPVSIEWSHDRPNVLAVGSDLGDIQLWDATTKSRSGSSWEKYDFKVRGMSWNRDLLAVGLGDGTVVVYDSRAPMPVGKTKTHDGDAYGVRWCSKGEYLASSSRSGMVCIWDARAGKELLKAGTKYKRLAHFGNPVKALAWCPWKPELLATGTTQGGKIHVWNIKSSAEPPEPVHTLSLHTSVTSLIWSPHSKELLSTHGVSWAPTAVSATTPHEMTRSVLTNSLLVHKYPKMKRLVSVTAHMGSVGHSCLSPDGTMVFTVCPAEEAMKMWKVWGLPDYTKKRESVFDKFTIR